MKNRFVVVACLLAREELKKKGTVSGYTTYSKEIGTWSILTLSPDLLSDDTEFFQYYRMSRAKLDYQMLSERAGGAQ